MDCSSAVCAIQIFRSDAESVMKEQKSLWYYEVFFSSSQFAHSGTHKILDHIAVVLIYTHKLEKHPNTDMVT